MSTLFLKYRPRSFADLVGQTAVARTLQNAIGQGRAAHAYLFSGSRGTGKTSTARIFAKALLTAQLPADSAVTAEELETMVDQGQLVDVIEIDAASNRGIDQIRDLREKVKFAPNLAPAKVYIIDEVHMLTKEAFNALLKTLEEPPEHAYFVLATTEVHRLPDTIISRCQVFTFQRFALSEMAGRLNYICEQEGYAADGAALDLIAQKAEGGMRDAISFLEQIAAQGDGQVTEATVRETLGLADTQTLCDFTEAMLGGETEAAFAILQGLGRDGRDLRSFGHDLLGHLRERLHGSLNAPELPRLVAVIEVVQEALGRLKTSPIAVLPFEIALVKLSGVAPAVNTASTKKVTPAKPKKAQPVASKPKPSAPVETKSAERKQPVTTAAEPQIPTKTVKAPVVEQSPPPSSPSPEAAAGDGFVFDDGGSPTPTKPVAKKVSPNQEEGGTPVVEADPPTAKPAGAAPGVTDLQGVIAAVEGQMKAIGVKAGLKAFVKRSFQSTVPTLAEGRLVFETDSQFHLEKLDHLSIKHDLAVAIKELTGFGVEIEFRKNLALAQEKGAAMDAGPTGDHASAADFLSF